MIDVILYYFIMLYFIARYLEYVSAMCDSSSWNVLEIILISYKIGVNSDATIVNQEIIQYYR